MKPQLSGKKIHAPENPILGNFLFLTKPCLPLKTLSGMGVVVA